MNYERMWKKLKIRLVGESGNERMNPGAAEHCRSILLTMARLESEEYKKDDKAGTCDYTVRQDIIGNVDVKATDILGIARETFKQITGHKVIDSLEELESEIRKRKGKTLLSDAREPIVVDEKVDIPEHMRHEADLHGIRIARFGVDVISTDTLPKGVFMAKKISPDGFPG